MSSRVHSDLNSSVISESIPKNVFREIVCTDSIEWMRGLGGLPEGSSGFTSIPDITELDAMFGAGVGADYGGYTDWFITAAILLMRSLPQANGSNASYCIFLQSDGRIMDGERTAGWVDKAHMCSVAAAKAGFRIMWHKLVCMF